MGDRTCLYRPLLAFDTRDNAVVPFDLPGPISPFFLPPLPPPPPSSSFLRRAAHHGVVGNVKMKFLRTRTAATLLPLPFHNNLVTHADNPE